MADLRTLFDGEGAVATLLESSASSVVAVDQRGTIVYVTQRALRHLGYAAAELLGRPVEVLVAEDLREVHEGHRATYERSPHPRSSTSGPQIRARRKDGSLWAVEIALTPITTSRGTWTLAAMADVEAREVAERRLVALSRAYLSLAHTNQAVVRAPDESALYADTCAVAVDEGGYRAARVVAPGPGHSVVELARAGSLDDYLDALDVSTDPEDALGRGPTGRALRDGIAHFSADPRTDPMTAPWHGLTTRHDLGATATLPLRRGGEVVAALTLYADEPDAFDHHLRSLLDSLATNVSFALDSFEAQRALQRTAAHRTELLARLVAAQEEERARIADDVHDDSVQVLAALTLRVGILRRRAEDVAPELLDEIDLIEEGVTGATGRLRSLMFDLEPAVPGAPLVEQLRDTAAQVLEDAPTWSVHLVSGDAVDGLGPEELLAGLPDLVRSQVNRIAREALVNARKHARARHVAVLVTPGASGVEVAVIDDGVGIDPDRARPRPGHRGLAAMRERAEIAGGWFRIDAVDRGTTLRFWLPRLGPEASLVPPAAPDRSGSTGHGAA